MSQYKTGTVSVTNGSNVVTGVGTLWSSNISVGNFFIKSGDVVGYTVASVISDTSITLTGNYSGTTSASSDYGITIDFTPNLALPTINAGDLNTAAINSEQMRLLDNLDLSGLELTGSFILSLDDSLGSTITEGANATYSATYRILGGRANIDVMINFDDGATTPLTGDRIKLDGVPLSLAVDGVFIAGEAQLYSHFGNGNNAFYQASRTGNTIWLTCTNVFGAITYDSDLTISMSYKLQ